MKKNVNSALKSAAALLEDAMKAVLKKDETKIRELVWKASSELEYALFVLSLMINEDEKLTKTKMKLDVDPNYKNDLGAVLVSAQDLTVEAQKLLDKKHFEEAYRRVKAARNYLLRLHEAFEKQRKAKRSKS